MRGYGLQAQTIICDRRRQSEQIRKLTLQADEMTDETWGLPHYAL